MDVSSGWQNYPARMGTTNPEEHYLPIWTNQHLQLGLGLVYRVGWSILNDGRKEPGKCQDTKFLGKRHLVPEKTNAVSNAALLYLEVVTILGLLHPIHRPVISPDCAGDAEKTKLPRLPASEVMLICSSFHRRSSSFFAGASHLL